MKKKKEYIPPEIQVIRLFTEPFMSQSGSSLFPNKTGIRQGENDGTSLSGKSFWDIPPLSGK